MATVNGLTAERMQEIIDATIVGAHITGDDLILELFDATEINVGDVRGPIGLTGPMGEITLAIGDARYVNLDGDTMSGHLLGITPTAAAHLSRKDYVDAQDALRLLLTGGTLSGHLLGITPTLAAHLARKDYVDAQRDTRVATAGDSMSGHLSGITPTSAAHLSRKDYVDNQRDTRVAKTGDVMSGTLLLDSGSTPQVSLGTDGRITSICNNVGSANLGCTRTLSSAIVAGQPFIGFVRVADVIGNITIASATTTGYNTSSDEDAKDNIVPIEDDLALYWLRVTQPFLFNFKVEPDKTHVGYVAQRMAAAWPESIELGIVTPAFDYTDDDDNEIHVGWMIDYSKFTPLLHAALQAIDRRVVSLEARMAVVEAGPNRIRG